jgi:ATP-grasp domain, R2K clade family 2
MRPRRSFLLPPDATTTGHLLADEAARRSLEVRTLTGHPVPGDLKGRAHLYGGERFADAVARELEVALLEPPIDLLPSLPLEFTGRQVELVTADQARRMRRARFLKPASGKHFPARVYRDGAELPPDLAADLAVLCAEPVVFGEEYRLHVLDGVVHASSRYASYGVLDPALLPGGHPALGFAAELLSEIAGELPSAVVIDVGFLAVGGRPVVVEANEAWFSHCYAADAGRVLDVVLRAAGPIGDVLDRDVPFLRRISPGRSRRAGSWP